MHDDDDDDRYHTSWPTSLGPAAPSVRRDDDYASFIELARTDPTGLAMMVTQQSNDRLVAILERMLMSSVSRLDRVLGTNISSSQYINEALQTLTKGASKVAGLGVNLFNQGLEGQARVARMEHVSELGKERTELMRDTVKQGSLLVQAVLMAQHAKQERTSTAAPSAAPPSPPLSVDAEIVAKARRLLELATDEVLDDLRGVAPSLAGVFDDLREPVTADRVRAVIHGAQSSVDPVELGMASRRFGPELSHAFGTLVMRVLSEDRA